MGGFPSGTRLLPGNLSMTRANSGLPLEATAAGAGQEADSGGFFLGRVTGQDPCRLFLPLPGSSCRLSPFIPSVRAFFITQGN